MRNTVTISVEFYFKGEQFLPSMTLDLDASMEKNGELPTIETLYAMLAEHNNIDTYSYQFEVMVMEPLAFSSVQGRVGDYIQEDELDSDAFEKDWRQNRIRKQLSEIAAKHLAIDNLEQEPKLQAALFDAYTLGSSSVKK